MQRVTQSLVAATLLLAGCGAQNPGASSSNDIYANDAKTRRRATTEEMRWTVSMHGCTGSMLSPKYMLTAHHCNPRPGARYVSGASLAAGKGNDLEAVRVAERHASFDYAIVEVQWLAGKPSVGQKYSPRIATKASDLKLGRDGVATRLVTVGFPTDKRGDAIFAAGWAKEYAGNLLYYNVGSINGNSGGAVWRASDYMLVSQTNFGNHAYGQDGWNSNNPEHSGSWNGGGAMYKLYAQSPLLKEIFPGGDNKYADAKGNLTVRQL